MTYITPLYTNDFLSPVPRHFKHLALPFLPEPSHSKQDLIISWYSNSGKNPKPLHLLQCGPLFIKRVASSRLYERGPPFPCLSSICSFILKARQLFFAFVINATFSPNSNRLKYDVKISTSVASGNSPSVAA